MLQRGRELPLNRIMRASRLLSDKTTIDKGACPLALTDKKKRACRPLSDKPQKLKSNGNNSNE